MGAENWWKERLATFSKKVRSRLFDGYEDHGVVFSSSPPEALIRELQRDAVSAARLCFILWQRCEDLCIELERAEKCPLCSAPHRSLEEAMKEEVKL